MIGTNTVTTVMTTHAAHTAMLEHTGQNSFAPCDGVSRDGVASRDGVSLLVQANSTDLAAMGAVVLQKRYNGRDYGN